MTDALRVRTHTTRVHVSLQRRVCTFGCLMKQSRRLCTCEGSLLVRLELCEHNWFGDFNEFQDFQEFHENLTSPQNETPQNVKNI